MENMTMRTDAPFDAVAFDAESKALEAQDIQQIKAGAEHLFLYVRKVDTTRETHRWEIRTWLGTVLASNAYVGRPSVRRAVTCRIFGVLYHGTYYESSGDYCRLRRAKRQMRERLAEGEI